MVYTCAWKAHSIVAFPERHALAI